MAGGERINTAKKAEVISKQLFEEFHWESSVITNINWACTMSKVHNERSHHPSDCVYYYNEPYKKIRTYVNCDLKSFKSTSIKSGEIDKALKSLIQSIECATKSEEWKENFVHDDESYEVCGLLFIYNHDNAYDNSKFNQELDKIKIEKLNIPVGQKVAVFGPDTINWLNNVRLDIKSLRGSTPPKLPAREFCKYHYPNLVKVKNIQPIRARAATIEMLTGPWIVLEYEAFRKNPPGFIIYYREKGKTEDEFLYLIDYIMHYQMLKSSNDITIRLYKSDPKAISYFTRAKQKYLESFGESDDLRDILNSISIENMNDLQTTFSDIEVGMM